MCIEYSNLNNTCLIDHYPLPDINQEVESLEAFQLKSFVDAYKGYHQVQMCKEDEEKTTFHTDRDTLFYQKMSFGLKNSEATYQRLMGKIFIHQIGRNIEVYVDDTVIKSRDEAALLRDIEETFRTLAYAQVNSTQESAPLGWKRASSWDAR